VEFHVFQEDKAMVFWGQWVCNPSHGSSQNPSLSPRRQFPMIVCRSHCIHSHYIHSHYILSYYIQGLLHTWHNDEQVEYLRHPRIRIVYI